MNKIITWVIGVVAILALVISIGNAVGGSNQSVPSAPVLGGTTNYDALQLGDKLTTDGGILRSYTNSTSTTATTQTLLVGDILNYDTVILTPNVGALTLTLPASSTLTAMVPTAGDVQETCFYNATSTAAATITFAAGTGINIVTASSTTGLGIPSVQAGGTGCFKFIRQNATAAAFDITAAYTRYVTAD